MQMGRSKSVYQDNVKLSSKSNSIRNLIDEFENNEMVVDNNRSTVCSEQGYANSQLYG